MVEAAGSDAVESQHHLGMLDLVDESSMSRWRWLLWGLAAAGTLLNGMSLLLLGVGLPLAVDEFGMDAAVTGLVGAALVFGSVPGSLVGGRVADRVGRRPLLFADFAVVAGGAALSAFADSPVLLVVGQFIVGFGVGMDFPVGSSYIAETTPRTARARLVVASMAMQAVGMVLGAVIGLALVSALDHITAWRALMVLLGATATVVALARLSAPESPRWLMLNGRNAAAAAAVARIVPAAADRARGYAQAAGDLRHLVAGEHDGPGIGTLFSARWRRRTLLVAVPWFLMDIATYGVALFTPVLIGAMTKYTGDAGPLGKDIAEARSTSWVDLSLVAGAVLSIWIVPKLGHLRMQKVGFAGMAAGMAAMAGLSLLPGGAAAHIAVVLGALVVYNVFMNIGPNATTYALPPEIFPTELRGVAAGFASSAAKVGATIGAFALPPLQQAAGPAVVLGLMSVVSLSGLLATVLLGRGEVPQSQQLEAPHRRSSIHFVPR